MTAVLHRSTLQVSVNHVPVPTQELSLLIGVEVRQRLSFPTQLTATFLDDGAGVELDGVRPPADIDDEISVLLGDGTTLFGGRVVAREIERSDGGVSTTTLRAYDRLHDLRMDRHVRRHGSTTVAEVCAAIAAEYGATCDFQADDVDLVEPILQYGESDFAFLHRLAARVGISFVCHGDVLSFFDDALADEPLDLTVGSDLLTLGIDERAAMAVDEADVIAWHESEAGPVRRGAGAVSAGWFTAPPAVAAQADALDRHAQRTRVVARGVAVGNADISPGRRCRIDIAAASVEPQEVVVATTCHRFSAAEGYLADFSSEATTTAASPPGATYTLGRIVDLNDPDARGRIRVALTAYDDIETGWLSLVLPGAGAERGVIAVPDLDDRVIVLGPANDVGSGVVLGGITAGAELPDEPVESGTNERLIVRLPNGAALTLENDGLRIDDGFGTSLDLREDKVSLHSATDLDISAPGRRILISANLIDFERS